MNQNKKNMQIQIDHPVVNHQDFEKLSMNMKIQFLFHANFSKQYILDALAISNKKFIDVIWLYHNKTGRQNILDFISNQAKKKERQLMPRLNDDPVPFYELEDVSLRFKINYAFHFGVQKQFVIAKLRISNKRWIDVTWLYENENYKQKILNYLNEKKAA